MSENVQTKMDISKRKPAERTKVVAFRITPEAAEQICYTCKVLGVSKGEWLEGCAARDRRALKNVKDTVYDLKAIIEIIGMLKLYCVYAPTHRDMVRAKLALENLERDLKRALSEAPSFL